MPKLFYIVGLPASGKSTKAEELSKKYNANIHSSDVIREELSGDINNQNINTLVFEILHKRIKGEKGMKLIFQNSYGEERVIAEVQNEQEVIKEINKFLDEHNFKSYYIRTWMRNKYEKVYDVGSHLEFFICNTKE